MKIIPKPALADMVRIELTVEEYVTLFDVMGSIDQSEPSISQDVYDAGMVLYNAIGDDLEARGILNSRSAKPGDTFIGADGKMETVSDSGATIGCGCEFCEAKRTAFFAGL